MWTASSPSSLSWVVISPSPLLSTFSYSCLWLYAFSIWLMGATSGEIGLISHSGIWFEPRSDSCGNTITQTKFMLLKIRTCRRDRIRISGDFSKMWIHWLMCFPLLRCVMINGWRCYNAATVIVQEDPLHIFRGHRSRLFEFRTDRLSRISQVSPIPIEFDCSPDGGYFEIGGRNQIGNQAIKSNRIEWLASLSFWY